MTRTLLILLFFATLITPFLLRRSIGLHSPSAPADSLHLVIMTPMSEPIKREFAAAFSAYHLSTYGKPVTLDFRALGGNDITRYFAAARETTFPKLQTYN